MCNIVIDENNKQVELKLIIKNLTPVEKLKVEEAFKQFRLKSKENLTKFKRRINRIIKEQTK